MRLRQRTVVVPLREPFASNTGVVDEVHQAVVELEWEGLTGYGTARDAEVADVARAQPGLSDVTPFQVRRVVEQLAADGVTQGALAAVDMALHDLLGKACRQPLHRLWGLAGTMPPPTAVSIGAGPDAELVARARALAQWPVIKLKLTPDDDGSRVALLRSVYAGRIRVDGNGSWTRDQALVIALRLAELDVDLLEQPVPPGALDDLQYLHERSPVPIFADEDCATPDDVLRLQGRVSGVNLKLVTAGGLLRARDMAILARRCGLEVMLGSKVESVLGVTAMAQLAPLADHLDLDGSLGLREDPFTGLTVDRGTVRLPEAPGVGAEPVQAWEMT